MDVLRQKAEPIINPDSISAKEIYIKMEYVQGHLETISNNGFLWIDIQKPTRDKLNTLAKKYPFHELNLEDCLSKIQIPKINRYEDHVFIILHFPSMEKDITIPRFSQLSIFAGVDYLVTVHQGDLKPLIELFQLCKQSDKQRQNIMGKSPGYLLHSIIDVLVDDHIEKILETLEESKETVEIYKDTDFMLNTEKSNKILAVLTILFTLSIPATTISTFYGMNVDLPGSLGHPARFLGPYTTMILVIAASITSALLMVWYFYRLRWIGGS